MFAEGPPVGAIFFAFQWLDSKPVDGAFHRIFARNNFAIVLFDRLPRPPNAFRFFGHVHIDEAHFFFFEKKLEHFVDVRFQRTEIGRFVGHTDGSAEGDAAQSE